MKKKQYQKPTMQVFMMKQRSQLLASSGSGNLDDYQWNGPTEE